jgi:6-phosphogluconolactonase (cycloisomerase 2 family)
MKLIQRRANQIGWMCTSFLILSLSGALHATTQAKFTVVPTAGAVTQVLLPSNFKQNVQYQVTNTTQITRTLTTVPIQGVTQITTGAGACPSPFTLAPQQSCLLNLQVNASQMSASGILGGPQVCKTQSNSTSPDLFLCSEPSPAQSLGFSTTNKGQFVFVTNQGAGNISSCQIGSEDRLLGGCFIAATGFSAPEALTMNPLRTMLYVTDTGTNAISRCSFDDATGTVSACVDAGGTGFNLPSGASVSPDGSVLYVSNGGGISAVTACNISATTGSLSGCVQNTIPGVDTAFDLTLNNGGDRLYIADFVNSTIAVCRANVTTVDLCDNTSGTNFDGPEGVTLSPLGRNLYVANNTSNNITRCTTDVETGLLSACNVTSGNFDGDGNIALNNTGEFSYIPNFALNQLFLCSVQAETGELFNCKDSLGSGFDRPAGVLVR